MGAVPPDAPAVLLGPGGDRRVRVHGRRLAVVAGLVALLSVAVAVARNVSSRVASLTVNPEVTVPVGGEIRRSGRCVGVGAKREVRARASAPDQLRRAELRDGCVRGALWRRGTLLLTNGAVSHAPPRHESIEG